MERLLTVDEAKVRWCPLARDHNTAGNRIPYGSAGDGPCEHDYTMEVAARFPCIASDCMAWRWGRGPNYEHRTHGYCGLAGQP